MNEVTDADRDKAYRALWPLTRYRWPRDDEITDEQRAQVERVAVALAEEQEKARDGVVQAQVDVLQGTATALAEGAPEAPLELRAGMQFAAHVVKQTADQIRRAADMTTTREETP